MKFLTKKNIFNFSLAGTITFVVFFFFTYITACSSISFNGCYESKRYFFKPALLIVHFFVPLFILSLITYKMKDEIFKSWIRFSVWWIPLSIVLTLVSPTQRGSSYIPFPSVQNIVLVLSVGLFVIISLVKILLAYKKTK